MPGRWITRAAVAGLSLFAFGELISTGCGIVSAPISLPAAVAANDSPSLSGTVVDEHGQPLAGVELAIRVDHVVWEPIFGQTSVFHESKQNIDGRFDVKPKRGRELELTFSKEGYHDRVIRVHAHEMTFGFDTLTYGISWPREASAVAMLVRKDHVYPTLVPFDHELPLDERSAFRGVNLRGKSNTLYVANQRKPGILYVDVEPASAALVSRSSDVTKQLPERVTLRIEGPDAGFVSVPLVPAMHPFAQLFDAPQTGYQPRLVLDRATLVSMRETHSYDPQVVRLFFVHVGDRYGKGMLRLTHPDDKGGPFGLRMKIFMQPDANNHDVSTKEDDGAWLDR